MLLARFIAPDRTIQVLLPMIESEEYPVNLAAVKMMTQLIENSSNEAIVDFLPDMIPVLLKVCLCYVMLHGYRESARLDTSRQWWL